MKLSIVIPTLGRTVEFKSLLDSILKSNVNDCEIVVVDQNFSDILIPIINKYKEFLLISHYKVDFRGLSKAKNFGITKVKGEIICFVDDDAEFYPNTIQIAIEKIESLKADIVSGRCVDRNQKNSVKIFDLNSSWLTKKSFEGKFIESTMFFRRHCFQKYSYDEKLGIGSFHGSEEGFDLIYRMVNDGLRIYYDSTILFYHPQVITTHMSDIEIKRVFTYRCGFSYVCMKHQLHKKYYSRLILVLLYLPYICAFKRKHTRYYVSELLGLIAGRVVR